MPAFPEQGGSRNTWGTELRDFFSPIFNLTTGAFKIAQAVLFGTDNSVDIGASGASRPRTGYFGTSVVSPIFDGAPPAYTKATLPAPALAGKVARVTDDIRGLWMDSGTAWFNLNHNVMTLWDFGAVGDGVVDDTAAVQAALDELTNGISLFIPLATFRVTSQLNVSGEDVWRIFGAGSAIPGASGVPSSAIKWDGASGGTVFKASECRYIRLEDFTIDGNSLAGIGIHFESTQTVASHHPWFTRVRVDNCTVGATDNEGVAFYMGEDDVNALSAGFGSFRDCHASNNRVGVYLDNAAAQDYHFSNCQFTGTGKGNAGTCFLRINRGGSGTTIEGGSFSNHEFHYNLKSGSIVVNGGIYEGCPIMDWESHYQKPPLFIGISDSGDYDGDALRAAGSITPITIGCKLTGGIDLVDASQSAGISFGDLIETGAVLRRGGSQHATEHGLYGIGHNYEVDEGRQGFGTTGRIIAAGNTLGSEMVTDGDCELANMTNWPDIGSPTTTEKNTTTPIGGTRDIHVVVGAGAAESGVSQTMASVLAGKIYRVTYTIRVISGTMSVELGHAGIEYHSVNHFTPAGKTPKNEVHELHFTIRQDSTLYIQFVSANTNACEFYFDDVTIKEVTDTVEGDKGSLVGNNAIFSQSLRLGGIPFASLGSPANGKFANCSDCNHGSNPCTGGGTGAFAKRLNGVWVCD